MVGLATEALAVVSLLAVFGGLVKRYVLNPIESKADNATGEAQQAKNIANKADEKAEEALDAHQDLRQLLVNGDSEAFDGILVRVQQDVEDLTGEVRAMRRTQREQAVVTDDMRRAINENLEGADIQDPEEYNWRGGESENDD